VADQNLALKAAVIRQCGENETVPLVNRQAVQENCACRSRRRAAGRGLQQIAAQTVSPAVIRTHDSGSGESAFRSPAQRGSPMPTGVVEGARDAVLARTTRIDCHSPRG